METTVWTFNLSVPFSEWAKIYDSEDVLKMHSSVGIKSLFRGVSKDDPTKVCAIQQGPAGAKCYWDNEPLTDGQGHNGYPPQIQVYWMQLGQDSGKDYLTVYGYYLDNNGGPNMKRMNNGQSWRLYPCHGECPW